MLNPKQKRFCEEYVFDLNGTQAAIRAGYSAKTAYAIAEENLRKPEIAAYVEVLQEELRKKADLKAEDIIQELRDLTEWNIQDFLSDDNTIRNLRTLPRKLTKAVVGIKTKTQTWKEGKKTVSETTVELKLADKRASAVDLGRHLGVFEKDNAQRKADPAAPPALTMSDDQADRIVNAINANRTKV